MARQQRCEDPSAGTSTLLDAPGMFWSAAEIKSGRSGYRTSVPGSRFVVVVLVACALLIGCGSGESPELGATEETTPAADEAEDNEPSGPGGSTPDPHRGTPGPKPTPGGPSTAAPAPGGGDIFTEVAVDDQEYLTPVGLDTQIEVGDLASVDILDLRRSDVEARVAGEISGPGVVVTVRLANLSSDELDLGWVTVHGEDASGLPLIPMSGPPAQPFFGPLASSSEADATYAFQLPQDAATPITITVNPAPDVPVAVFTGEPS